jgi:hypothetical protein
MVKELLRMGEKENILLIEKLITDEDFDKLKGHSKDINFYKVTGIDQNEIRHSNIIAWLFDPFENHNLGALFFQKFMSQLFENAPDYFNDRKINILNLLLNDFDDMEVFREKKAIDILVVSKSMNFVLCIENKINAGISDTQLIKYYKYINERYSSFNKIFLLLSRTGIEVPVDKSENPEDWIPASYEDIVKILRSLLELDIEQKVWYIIDDYIKLLEKEDIVENAELDGILSRLCTKHKDAIDLLLKYQESQPVIRRVQEIFKEIFLEYQNERKVICNKTIDSFSISFNTTNMNKYFQPVQDRSGSWRDGTKYKYWIFLKERSSKPRIFLQVGPLGQDDDTIKKMDLIRNAVNPKKRWTEQYNLIKDWEIDIDWTSDSLEILNKDEYVQEMKAEIRKTMDQILCWEETEVRKIFK